MDAEEFMQQFETALLLQAKINTQREQLLRERPLLDPTQRVSFLRAYERWRPELIALAVEFERWGQAFLTLIESAPAEILAVHPEILEAKARVERSLAKNSPWLAKQLSKDRR